MHPEIERQIAAQRVQELRRAGAAARHRAAAPPRPVDDRVVIRCAGAADHVAVAALAILDEAEPPLGTTLVAEVDGSIRAALPLDGPRPFADPFHRTGDLVALLRARARQIETRQRQPRRRYLAWLTPAGLRRLV